MLEAGGFTSIALMDSPVPFYFIIQFMKKLEIKVIYI